MDRTQRKAYGLKWIAWARHRGRPWKIMVIAAALLGWIWFWTALPDPLFDEPVATVVEDRHGRLLSARIAADEQWRFPPADSVTRRFAEAIIQFEDRRFYTHTGVDPLAVARAIKQNLDEKRIVSGASTLSMQVIRLSRKGQPRTVFEKAIEMVLAFRLELRYNKAEILALYAAHAPFGGNVVGLEAAAWRYFGRAPAQLSWSEMATLAVLPNNPALVHPGRNRDRLQEKRDGLLRRIHEAGLLDSLGTQLAMAERLPAAPLALPDDAPHLLQRIQQDATPGKHQQRTRTTIDGDLQERAHMAMLRHRTVLHANGIFNAAAIVIDNRTGDVLAYIGNIPSDDGINHGYAVDVIASPRSTGSILKPFLYAAMQDDALSLPRTLVADIPTRFGGFAPTNFNQRFEGALPADEALARSLNVPTARSLSDYGVARFHGMLKDMGMTTLTRPSTHYGLSLILGGSEGTLWDLAGMYAGMAGVLLNASRENANMPAVSYSLEDAGTTVNASSHPLSPASIWLTFDALTHVKRPEAEGLWEYFSSSRKVAWKTGTSYGFRDAWAIGVTPQYTVAVWAGNADGEGRPGLTGVIAAGPILFELFDVLQSDDLWFQQPMGQMAFVEVCEHSGHRAGRYCPKKTAQWVAPAGLRTTLCPYHREIHIDPVSRKRVHGGCASPLDMEQTSWFVLPPAMEWFYKVKQGNYKPLPAYREDCRLAANEAGNAPMMEFIYPRPRMTVVVPKELDGTFGAAVLEIAHRAPDTQVHWHLNNQYLGATRHFHQLDVNPTPGQHTLVVIDESGERLEQTFFVAASSGL